MVELIYRDLDRVQALRMILDTWLKIPEDQRTEVKMLGFAFDVAADPQFRFGPPPQTYRIIRTHLYEHGKLIGPISPA